MLPYALKNISRRATRSALTIGGVAMMMTLIITITGIVDYQVRTMNEHASAGSGKINVQPRLAGTGYPAEGIDLPESQADAILAHTAPYLQTRLSARVLYFTLKAPRYPNQPPERILIGIEAGSEEAFTGSIARDVKPVAGTEFFTESQAEHPAVLGQHAAETYAVESRQPVETGVTLDILGQEFTVIGILDRSADIVVNNAVMIPLAQAQALLDKPGFVSSVILTAIDIDADQDIAAVIAKQFPRQQVISDDTVRRNARSGIRIFEAMVNTISVVVVCCAALLMMTVTLTAIKERTKEIGVLRALGASRCMVIGAILYEILLLSLCGSLLGGVIAGFVLAFGLQENLFDLGHILRHLPLAVILTLLAGAAPAASISRILPVEALRYE